MSSKINIKNRKASYEYQFIATFVAGISLVGTEIKSIRNNQANISDAHCVFVDDELFVKSLHIDEYKNGGYINHVPKRDAKISLKFQLTNSTKIILNFKLINSKDIHLIMLRKTIFHFSFLH